ncbi:MAG: tetratricopeptide repeat protein [Elusimicrobiales bacterium]
MKTGYALAAAERAVERLLAAGRAGDACRLALASAKKLPGSPVLARLLEKTLSCRDDAAFAEKAYAGLLALPGVYPGNYYWLAMFRKRAGDYPGMKKAFEGFLRARGKSEPLHAYIACCTLDRYAEAFAAAEEVLDAPPPDAVLSRLWNPWGDRSSAMPAGFLQSRLARLEGAKLPPGLEHYRTFLRGALRYYSGDYKGALKTLAVTPARPPERYGWMRLPAGLAALYLCDFRRAEKEFSAAERAAVSRVTAMGRLAEVFACTGRRAAALRKMRAAQRVSPLWARAGLLAWEGQLLLFTGKYKESLAPLSEGGRLGDDAAWCWRGAALLKLGRVKEALADLDRAVELFPTDWEARVWRAEALRAAGRGREALADIEAVLAHGPNNWGYILRALLAGDAGDEKRTLADFRRVDPELRRALAGGGGARGALERAGRLALGGRRDEKYFNSIWLPRRGGGR